ncbi:iron complex transport system substrate-binding protein [Tritonibacter mobilis]|nr:iron complex transport system substrate-binding protein [Tritonibacter mobilis]
MVLNYGSNSWEALAEQLGRATGRESEAAEVAAQFNDRASKAGAEVIHPEGAVSIVSYNFFGTYGVSKPYAAQARVLRGTSVCGSDLH